jgi:hypothetical protein
MTTKMFSSSDSKVFDLGMELVEEMPSHSLDDGTESWRLCSRHEKTCGDIIPFHSNPIQAKISITDSWLEEGFIEFQGPTRLFGPV